MLGHVRKNYETFFLKGHSRSSMQIDSTELATIEADTNLKLEKISGIVEIKKLSSENIAKVLTLLGTSEYEQIFEDHENILYLKIQVEDNLAEITSPDLFRLISRGSSKAIIILTSSTTENISCLYWKPRELHYFLKFSPHQGDSLNENHVLCEYIGNFLVESLKNGHIGLSKNCLFQRESFNIELHHFADIRNYNLLLVASESGHNKIVEILLKAGISATDNDEKINAQGLAWNGQHLDVVLTLLKANLVYPASFDYEQCSYNLKAFYDRTAEIHEAIISGDFDKVKQIVNQNPNIFFFYNSRNESAAKIALTHEKIEIYEFLLVNGVFFGPHENTSDVMEDLDWKLQKIVRDIHFKHSKEIQARHINILMAHSFICHDVPNVKKALKLIQHAYSVLNKNPFIEPILKIVAASQNYRIIFDFNRESVNFLDPTVDPHTQGLFYMSGRIYVGAKQLLDPSTQNQAVANLGHELGHYAMQLGFNNLANPYEENDLKTKKIFEEISQECQKNSQKEEIIEMVYTLYPEDMHHAELIVRAVHLYAFYDNFPEKMDEVRGNYKRFFNFYEQIIVKRIKEAIPRVEGKDAEELKRKQKQISKLIFYFAIFAVFSVTSLALISLILYSPTHTFDNLSKKDQMTVENAFVSYKHVKVKFSYIFPNDSLAYDKLTSDHISVMLNNEVLNLDDPYSLYLNSFIVHDWKNLTEELKNKVLKSNFTFQNESVRFGDIYKQGYEDLNVPKKITLSEMSEHEIVHNMAPVPKTTAVLRNPFDFLTSNQIKSILDGESLEIGFMLENKTNFYVERTFIYEDTRPAYIIYQRSQTLVNVDYEVGFKYFPNFAQNLKTWENEGLLDGYSLINGTIRDIYRLLSSIDFDKYVQTLSGVERSSYIKNNEQYYEDLNSNVFSFLHRAFDDIYRIAKEEQILILSSIAGAGKTVAFEQLAMKMKKKFPFLWISYIDLKDYMHLYKSYDSVEEIKELLLTILKLSEQNKFEKALFEKFFKSGNVVLLWNGFDEISPTYSEEVLGLIRKIRQETKNIQFICTRPLYSELLRDYFRVRIYQLLPYNKNEQREFLTKFYLFSVDKMSTVMTLSDITSEHKKFLFNSSSIISNIPEYNVNPTQIDIFIDKVRESIKKLSVKGLTSESLESSRDFNTPLMLILLGENFIDDDNFDAENFYEIYQNFVYKKVKIWSEIGIGKEISNKIIANSLGLSVPEIHQRYALPKEIFERLHTIVTVNLKKLKIMKKFILPDLSWQEISRLGMLYINGETKYEFVHKTFGEFFTAQYLIQSIYYADEDVNKDESFRRLELFFYMAQNYGNNQLMVTEFVESFVQTQKVSIGSFSPAISELIKTTFKKFFFNLVNPKFSKLFKFLLDFFRKDREILLELLHVNEDETLYTAAFNPAYYLRLVNPQDILKIVRKGEYLSEKEFQRFISGRNQRGKIMLGLFHFESQGKLKIHSEYKFNASYSSHWDFLENLSQNLTQAEKKEAYKNAISPAFYAASEQAVIFKLDKILDKFEGLLTKAEIQMTIASTIDQLIRKYPEFEFFDRPVNVIEFLMTKCEKLLKDHEIFDMFMDHKILHIGTYNHLAFKVLWKYFENHTNEDQQRRILKATDELKYYKKIDYYYFDYNVPLTILHLTLMREKYEDYDYLYEFVEEKYFKLFSRSEILDIIASSSDFLVQFMSRNFDAPDLMEYLKRIYKGSENLLVKFLKQKVKHTNSSVFEYFDELRTAQKFHTKMEVFNNFVKEFNIIE